MFRSVEREFKGSADQAFILKRFDDEAIELRRRLAVRMQEQKCFSGSHLSARIASDCAVPNVVSFYDLGVALAGDVHSAVG